MRCNTIVRQMQRARQRRPNSRTMSPECNTRSRVVTTPLMRDASRRSLVSRRARWYERNFGRKPGSRTPQTSSAPSSGLGPPSHLRCTAKNALRGPAHAPSSSPCVSSERVRHGSRNVAIDRRAGHDLHCCKKGRLCPFDNTQAGLTHPGKSPSSRVCGRRARSPRRPATRARHRRERTQPPRTR